MKFDFLNVMFNPIFLLVLTVTLGVFLLNLKFLGKLRMGVGGPLFAGIFIGKGITSLARLIASGGYNSDGLLAKFVTDASISSAKTLISGRIIPSALSNFMLILFICSVSLLASKDLNLVLKKYGAKFIIFGFIITFTGAGLSYATQWIYGNTNAYEAAGIFTGALTSSPGMAAAVEKAETYADRNSNSENLTDEQRENAISQAAAGVNTSYAISYPFGVICTILAMTLLPKIFRIDVKKELEGYRAEIEQMRGTPSVKQIKPVTFDIKAFTLAATLGYLLGIVQIPMGALGYFSLGSTGGVLIASVLLGYIGKIGPFTFRMDGKVLGSVKDLALAFYIGSMGINYGNDVIEAFAGRGIYFVIASCLVALLCILVGFVVGRYAMKINYVMLIGAICGGMTSTPGLGMAIDSVGSDEPAAGYAAAYPSAIIGMVLFVIIMYNLPTPL